MFRTLQAPPSKKVWPERQPSNLQASQTPQDEVIDEFFKDDHVDYSRQQQDDSI